MLPIRIILPLNGLYCLCSVSFPYKNHVILYRLWCSMCSRVKLLMMVQVVLIMPAITRRQCGHCHILFYGPHSPCFKHWWDNSSAMILCMTPKFCNDEVSGGMH